MLEDRVSETLQFLGVLAVLAGAGVAAKKFRTVETIVSACIVLAAASAGGLMAYLSASAMLSGNWLGGVALLVGALPILLIVILSPLSAAREYLNQRRKRQK